MFMRNSYFLILFSILVLLPACGYQLAGTGTAQLPPHLKTIAIPVIDNTSQEPTINRNLTESLRQAFIRDGRLKLVKQSDQADLVLNGKLVRYSIRAVGFDNSDVANEYWVYLDLSIDVHLACADGAVHVGGPADQPARGRRPDDRTGLHLTDLRRPDQHGAERPDE